MTLTKQLENLEFRIHKKEVEEGFLITIYTEFNDLLESFNIKSNYEENDCIYIDKLKGIVKIVDDYRSSRELKFV